MSALTDVFTAIANAIRSKKGVSTTYKPSEMASAISSISTGTDTSDATLESPFQMVYPATAYSKGTKITGSLGYASDIIHNPSSNTLTVYFDVYEVICFYTKVGVDNIVTHYDYVGNYDNPTTKVRKISSSEASTVEMASITNDGIKGVTRDWSNHYTITLAPKSSSSIGGYHIIIIGKYNGLS